MSAFVEKGLSLVERKKLQWARERDELAKLNAYWSRDTQGLDQTTFRGRNASKFPPTKYDYLRRDSSSSSASRRPSLPPLPQSKSYNFERIEREMGGETSGYGSDNPNHPEDFHHNTWNSAGYESSSSSREDRAKWGDRGIHVGKFWEPKDEDLERTDDPPSWVKRGLERKTELIVSNMSPAESPEQTHLTEDDRPYTGSSGSHARTYIRGQNAPVEPIELAERERKRQIALAHQEAIREQLEERERKRREEKERRMREEREEELRIEREQEQERKRKEREAQIQQEKIEREKKRKQAMQEAIEFAERQAREEKLKQKNVKQNNDINKNINEKTIEKEKSPRSDILIINNISGNGNGVECKDVNNAMNNLQIEEKVKKDEINISTKENNNYSNKENNSVNKEISNNLNKDANNKVINEDDTDLKINNKVPPLTMNLQTTQNTCDNLALVLQTPVETLQNMQFAVLMPNGAGGSATALPIAVPIALTSERSNTGRTENRILTPSQYRNKRFCDSSTQTDLELFSKQDITDQREKYMREKITNLEMSRRRASRNDERSVEERPKWGANRPPTRYLKQSEKDPLYQRRKRQKQRQIKPYEDKSQYSAHSSDDSQTGSPRTYRKRGYDKRHGRALWRKNEQLFSHNVRIFQTEIMPLESDKDQLYYKTKSGHDCCCSCRCSEKHKMVDILKIERNNSPERFKSSIERLPDCIKSSNYNSIDSNSELMEKFNSLAVNKDSWDSIQNSSFCSPSRGNSGN